MADDILSAASVLYSIDVIDEVVFLQIVKEAEETAPVFLYWDYDRFDLEKMLEDECRSEFRFSKDDIPRLAQALRLPPKFVCPNGTTVQDLADLNLKFVSSLERLWAMFLERLVIF